MNSHTIKGIYAGAITLIFAVWALFVTVAAHSTMSGRVPPHHMDVMVGGLVLILGMICAAPLVGIIADRLSTTEVSE